MAIFKGSGVALATPMHEDGTINYEKLEELLEFQISGGTDAIIICGTTGETAAMTGEEHLETIRFAVEKVNGRIPVSRERAPIAHARQSGSLRKPHAWALTGFFW